MLLAVLSYVAFNDLIRDSAQLVFMDPSVYRARCKPSGEAVAIKRLNLDKNWDLAALIREATLMKRLSHPNVLPLHAAFVHGRELWMVMPLMGLGSLRSIMKREFPQGLDEIVIATIMKYVLLGLEYLHKNGGIHRDVKADNILLAPGGEVVLADFGVAACHNTCNVSMVNIDMDALMASTFVGTPCWMAPEVMQQEDGYSTSADIWSFGITMIELAHGQPPLAKVHPMRVLMDTMQKPPPCLEDHSAGLKFSRARCPLAVWFCMRISQCMKEVVELCLQKDPALRPTATSLLSHRFFKSVAREADFLEAHFLAGLAPPSGEAPGGKRSNSIFSRAAAGSAIGMFQDGLSFAAGRLKSSWCFPLQQPQQQPQLEAAVEDEDSQQTMDIIPPPLVTPLQANSAGASSCDNTAAAPWFVEVQLHQVPAGPDTKFAGVAQQQQQLEPCPAASRLLFKASSAGARVGASAEPHGRLQGVFSKLTRAFSLGSGSAEAPGGNSSGHT
eukprot:gene2775-3068_t